MRHPAVVDDHLFLRPRAGEVAPEQRDDDPATLVHVARWHAGLTQAEVAQRAGTSQQAVARYESGRTLPSLDALRRVLAACGMRLELNVQPVAGLIDQPTRELLALPPMRRLTPELREVVVRLVGAFDDVGLPAVVAGRAAARLRGALVRVVELEFWVDDRTDPALLERVVALAGGSFHRIKAAAGSAMGRPRVAVAQAGFAGRDIDLRGMPELDRHLPDATPLATDAGTLLVVGAADARLFWHPRDRDHLALQRAVALRAEDREPEAL
jgi:transcriptional regulator with XRE-family HTH domain